jgi:sperm-associated antigen 16 protein
MNSVPPLPIKALIKPESNRPLTTPSIANTPSETDIKTFNLEDTTIPCLESDEEEVDFDEVPIEQFDELSDSDVEESLEQTVRNIHQKSLFRSKPAKQNEEPVVELVKHPEVVDDFIRNFLASKGLVKTLDSFQNEWYELQQEDKITKEDILLVPNVYQQNRQLSDAVSTLQQEVTLYKDIATKARSTYDKLRKERDFHRMHHKRVVQEKGKLIADMKRLKKHYDNYEPTLKQLQTKYEAAMKEKMLTKLERDRLATRMSTLEHQIKNIDNDMESQHKKKSESSIQQKERINIYANMSLPIVKPEKLCLSHQVQAHTMAISSLKFHPKKPILATVSDDKSWKLWAFPSGELIMSGQGHQDWIADSDFHPSGNKLATASGDSTVKLWDFSKGIATATLADHTHAVWSCSFHDQGQFLLSGSMDTTAKLWDLSVATCKQTFRGHAESVNCVGYMPFTDNLFTCSGDKTVSMWDCRTGICTQTLYGHLNAVNHGVFSLNVYCVNIGH